MKKATILIVADEHFARHLDTESLIHAGYAVELTVLGEGIVSRLLRGDVDLLLLDLSSADGGGFDLLSETEKLNNPPAILLATEQNGLETTLWAGNHDIRDCLLKPFSAGQLFHAVRNCLERRNLQKENSRLKDQLRLYEAGRNLVTQMDIAILLDQAIQTIRHELGGGRGFAFLQERNKSPKIFGHIGQDTDSQMLGLAQVLLPALKSRSGPYFLAKEELEDLPRDHFYPADLSRLYAFPLRFRGWLRGALFFYNPPEDPWPQPAPMDNLTFLAEQAAIGFQNACHYQGTRELIYIDDLTGLHNYRYLQTVLDQEIRRAERYNLEMALIFLDLDHFKRVNDSRGHLAGSQVLKEVAELLRRNVREVDLVFRYGGDEFTVILVETGKAGGSLVAERIRNALVKHAFLADHNDPVYLTATVGYSVYPMSAVNKQSLIDLADQAMYQGKQMRNVVRGAWELSHN